MTRKVVLQMQMTLDGFAGATDGSVDWAFPAFDGDFTAWGVDALWQAGVHIMGAETGRGLAAYWPSPTEPRDEPFARPMNEIPKVVFSRTLQGLDWQGTRIVGGELAEEIARLKGEGEGHVLVHGGVRLAQSLIRLGLVDEYHLVVHPVVLGEGLSIFPVMASPLRLEAVETRPFASGAVLHVMRPAAIE